MNTLQPDSPEQQHSIVPVTRNVLSRKLAHVFIALIVLTLDALMGPFLTFPILFILPVSLGSWYCGARWGTILAVILPAGAGSISVWLEKPQPITFIIANAAIRIAVFLFIVYLVNRTAHQTRELKREVRMLQGILPICMFCKRIRDEKQDWQRIESYISKHSEAYFSHSLCPECAKKHYGDVFTGKQVS